jgi:hypothetical protein
VSRLASSALVAGYLVIGMLAGGPGETLKVLAFCVVPLACIWFPEALGDYTGYLVFDRITKASPSIFVWFMGWVVLLLPLIVALILWLEGVSLDGSLR